VPVPEPADPAAPSTAPRPRRPRKFVLPEHHHDERGDKRTAGHIEAFLEGPIPAPHPPRDRVAGRERRLLVLDTRQDWVTALRHEAARHARYGRPASVLLLGLRGRPPEPAVERIARTIGDVIRAEARETDRAVRTGRLSFRLLLPETGGRAARSLAERLERAYLAAPDGRADGVALTVEVASAPRNGRLEDALAEAELRFAGLSAPG
jgi:GGDEF domain-containing protein